jgi:hypothetical protein
MAGEVPEIAINGYRQACGKGFDAFFGKRI